jgi:hypothetical protein
MPGAYLENDAMNQDAIVFTLKTTSLTTFTVGLALALVGGIWPVIAGFVTLLAIAMTE